MKPSDLLPQSHVIFNSKKTGEVKKGMVLTFGESVANVSFYNGKYQETERVFLNDIIKVELEKTNLRL